MITYHIIKKTLIGWSGDPGWPIGQYKSEEIGTYESEVPI